jgi:voltage-gated potassium channel
VPGARTGQNRTVDPPSALAPRPGQPRDEHDQAVLARFAAYMRLPIVLAAVLPLFIVPQAGDPAAAAVGVVSWLVFLADFAVSERRRVRYLSTGLGRFDLTVVVLTAPWFLLPGAHAGSFVVVLRLARLLRVVIVSGGAKRLFERLGRVVVVAAIVVFTGAAVAYYAEHPTNPEFATFGDSLWWGIVTLTTVGYGDIVPKTTVGRLAGVMIMVSGISVVGILAGSLASFFRLGESQSGDDSSVPSDASGQPTPPPDGEQYRVLAREMAQLREQMARLSEHLARDSQYGSGDPP